MEFHTFGNPHTSSEKQNPTLLLIPGLGVSHEIFLPLIELLHDSFFIVALGIDGFLSSGESSFTSVDNQAEQAINYVQKKFGGNIDIAYGLSLGGKILSRILERNEICVRHAIMDAAPLLPLPKLIINPLRYYQCFNVWTCYHFDWFWRFVFHSHYFDVLLDEVKKVYPSGKGKAVLDGYKSVYTNKLESITGNDIHFWYGSKEAFVARPQVKHLLKLCPSAHIEVFPKMNHGQLLVDKPEEVAKRILDLKSELWTCG